MRKFWKIKEAHHGKTFIILFCSLRVCDEHKEIMIDETLDEWII
jgi:hypothetical protein